MKRIAILQSNYIPWKGYFDIINSVDEFVIYDDAQYTKRDWRNRNLIKTRNGLLWLTIPVKTKGRFNQNIYETEISGTNWTDKHFESIIYNYGSALYFENYKEMFLKAYRDSKSFRYLSEVNRLFIELINSILGIKTILSDSSDYIFHGNSNEKIIEICNQAGAEEYMTGSAAREYLDSGLLESSGIKTIWADYSGYPEYEQLYPPFQHNVSIIDLIFNKGEYANSYMKSF
jgi:hypothetical protein